MFGKPLNVEKARIDRVLGNGERFFRTAQFLPGEPLILTTGGGRGGAGLPMLGLALWVLGQLAVLVPAAVARELRAVVRSSLLLALPLAVTTFRVATDSIVQVRARQITSEWIDSAELEHELNRVTANQRDLLIELNGPQDPPPISDLAEKLEEALPLLGTATLRIHYANDLPIERTAEPEP